jgi:CRP/FNR family transcriptional regulator, cyclic AMP receptor protein
VLESIGESERRDLLRLAVRRRFARGEIVFHEGDPGESLHIVTSGVFLARSSSTLGALIGVNIFGEGSVFGELALLSDEPQRSATVVALHEGTTLALARSHFEALRARNPRIDRFLVSVLAKRNRRLTTHLVELLFAPAELRVYRQLLAFSDMVGPSPNGWVRLRQSELAMLAGTTRSTTNRALRRAEERGLVELARGRVRIVDLSALRARAEQ